MAYNTPTSTKPDNTLDVIAHQSRSWQWRIFSFTMIGSVLFLVLTFIAMLYYPGDNLFDPKTSGYSFASNFFSDLGRTRTYAGEPNTVSAILFVTALTMSGGGLILFSLAFPSLINGSRSGKVLTVIGSIFGVAAGLSFIGVAFTPVNLNFKTHSFFVLLAFITFNLAVICYTFAIFREPGYPNRFGVIFFVFAVLLFLYVLLLEIGPAIHSPNGFMVQAIGQKIIVYASVIIIFIEAFAAQKIVGRTNNANQI